MPSSRAQHKSHSITWYRMTEESKIHSEKIQLFESNRPDTPVPNKERILYLDILRGIAILFIFLANIKVFSGAYFMSDAEKLSMNTAALDQVLRVLDFLFVDGKFYSVFSILFGIGFAVQYQRMKKDDSVFVPFFMKRMTGLLLIGAIHLFLLWLGDILTLYALLGFILISFRHFTNKKFTDLGRNSFVYASCSLAYYVSHQHLLPGLSGWKIL